MAWEMGKEADGSDSRAVQVADDDHWPEMNVLILVVSAEKKAVGSTEGMQAPVQDDLLNIRARDTVPPRMLQMEKAIADKDIKTFATLTMADSDDFHHICHMTIPPLHYMNDVSRDIVKLVNAYNAYRGETNVAYTFDAGPNAVIYLLDHETPLFLALVYHFFPHHTPIRKGHHRAADDDLLARGRAALTPAVIDFVAHHASLQPHENSLCYIIDTRLGPGPQILPSSQALF